MRRSVIELVGGPYCGMVIDPTAKTPSAYSFELLDATTLLMHPRGDHARAIYDRHHSHWWQYRKELSNA